MLQNAVRTPGCSLLPEYYEDINKAVAIFLYDVYNGVPHETKPTHETILGWCNEHYQGAPNQMCIDFFCYEPMIAHLKELCDEE